MFASGRGEIMATMTLATRVSGPAVRIRRARPPEAAALAVLGLRALAEFEADFPDAVWQAMRAEWADVGRRLAEAHVLAARLDGELVGTVTLDLRGNASVPVPRLLRVAALRVLAVDRAFRRQGIGRALTDECRRRAAQLGLERLVATPTPFMVAARGVLEDRGFVRVPELDQAWTVGGVGRAEGWPAVSALAYVRAV